MSTQPAWLVGGVLLVVLGLSFGREVRAEPAKAPSGLDVRLDAGISWNRFASSPGPATYAVLGGPTVSLGWRFANGIEVGGGLALHAGKLYRVRDDRSSDPLVENKAVVLWPRVFAQLDYHLRPEGSVHFGAAAGFGSLTSLGSECDCYNVSGALNYAGPSFVVAPHFGLDFAVGRSWTMGPLFRLWLAPTERHGASGLIVAPELAFSAARF